MSIKTKTTATKEEATPALVPKLRFPEFREAEGWQLFPHEGETQPRLRFPEFQNAGEWVSEPLGDLGEIVTGKTPSTKESDLWGGDILFITPTDISEDEKYQHTTARTVIETKSTKILPVGSVVYTCIASIGKMALTVHPSISNQQINAVVPNNKVLGEFIYYALVNLTPWIKTIPATNTLPIINKTDFSKIAILLPKDKTEQQRIADCLTSLDDLIAAQTQKLEALKTHKKGLMQQLFPREGETQPRLRFPEFQNAGDWEPKTLGDVVKSFKTGKLDANAMVENGQFRFYTCAKNYYQIDHYAFEGEALLVAGNGAHLGYIHHYIGKFNAYQRTYVLQDFKANVVFLRCLLDRYLPARIQFEKKDGNTPYIVLSTLTEMPLVIPRDADEQERIATCLSSLDALITAETQKHEALKTHKKGLMQQLFPSPEEVEA